MCRCEKKALRRCSVESEVPPQWIADAARRWPKQRSASRSLFEYSQLSTIVALFLNDTVRFIFISSEACFLARYQAVATDLFQIDQDCFECKQWDLLRSSTWTWVWLFWVRRALHVQVLNRYRDLILTAYEAALKGDQAVATASWVVKMALRRERFWSFFNVWCGLPSGMPSNFQTDGIFSIACNVSTQLQKQKRFLKELFRVSTDFPSNILWGVVTAIALEPWNRVSLRNPTHHLCFHCSWETYSAHTQSVKSGALSYSVGEAAKPHELNEATYRVASGLL